VRRPDRARHDAATLGDVLEALGSATPGIIERAPIRAAAPPADTATGTPAIPPPSVDTLDRLLAWHVERHPHRTHVTLLDDGQEQAITYARLLEESRAVAGGLQRLGIQAGEAVALMLPTSADYFYAFFGALLAGAFPVPLYPPARASQIEEHVRRHAGIRASGAACAAAASHRAIGTGLAVRPVVVAAGGAQAEHRSAEPHCAPVPERA